MQAWPLRLPLPCRLCVSGKSVFIIAHQQAALLIQCFFKSIPFTKESQPQKWSFNFQATSGLWIFRGAGDEVTGASSIDQLPPGGALARQFADYGVIFLPLRQLDLY